MKNYEERPKVFTVFIREVVITKVRVGATSQEEALELAERGVGQRSPTPDFTYLEHPIYWRVIEEADI
jgi:hypothetical protein